MVSDKEAIPELLHTLLVCLGRIPVLHEQSPEEKGCIAESDEVRMGCMCADIRSMGAED